jgi:hypothetical protein
LVYLLDCSKLKTQEEKQMFQRLKEINPQLLKRLSNRLFFLVTPLIPLLSPLFLPCAYFHSSVHISYIIFDSLSSYVFPLTQPPSFP